MAVLLGPGLIVGVGTLQVVFRREDVEPETAG